MQEKKTITLELLNNNFSVVAENEQYVREIEAFVNENLQNILQYNPHTNHIQISLLGCMNIAEMYFEAKKKIGEKETELIEENKKNNTITEQLKKSQNDYISLKNNVDEQQEKISELEKIIDEKEIQLNQYREQLSQAKLESESNRNSILTLQSQLFESQIELSKNKKGE